MFLLILTLFISITLVFAVTFSIFCNNDEEKENTIWGFCIISIIVAFFSKILSTVLLSSLFLCALSDYIFGNRKNKKREKQITLLIFVFILIIIWFGFVVGLKVFVVSVVLIICFYIFRTFHKVLIQFKHADSENEPRCKIYGGSDSCFFNKYESIDDESENKSDNIQKSLWDELESYWYRGDYCSSQEEKNSFVGRLYELCVGEYLYQHGYAVSFNGAMKGFKDGGIDLIARNEPANLILLVQCKCWSSQREMYDNVLTQFYGSIEVFRRNYQLRTFRNFSFLGILASTKNNISNNFLDTAELLGIEYHCIPLRNRFPIVKFCPYGYLGKELYFPWEENYDSIDLKENVLLFQDMKSYQQYIENGKTDGDKISFFGKLASSENIMSFTKESKTTYL